MARTVRNAKIDTRSARASLKLRREPYWTALAPGRALGYRKGKNAGTWIVRFRDEHGRQHYGSLGAVDDALDADGGDILSYAQAQERARDWLKDLERRLMHGIAKGEVYTVDRAADDYLKWFKLHRKSYAQTKNVIDQFVRQPLGNVEVNRLTRKRIEDWHEGLAENRARVRTRAGTETKFKIREDPEADRRRKSTANRQLTVLKAMLNKAFENNRQTGVASDDAWRVVKPFRAVEAARVRYLSEQELWQFLAAASRHSNTDVSLHRFGKVAIGGVLTGARYGELVTGRAADFDPAAGTLFIPESKGGRARHVFLTDEGREFFVELTAGRSGNDLLFVDEHGGGWGRSEQLRPMIELSAAAKIEPAVSFHILRHTYASRLVMRGAPLMVVAQQLGHADTRMVEKHYGHLAPSYIADTVRAAFGNIGVASANVGA